MKNRWLDKNSAIIGSMATTDPAIKSGQLGLAYWYNSWKYVRPMGSVFFSMESMTSSGHMKEPQFPMKVKIVSVAKAGLESGRMMVQKMDHGLPPSILAASSKSFGIVRKNCRSRKVPY